MQHWIVDSQAEAMPSWLEALPGAIMFQSVAALPAVDGVCILWCRLRSGEDVDRLLTGLPLAPSMPVVVLADEPDETTVMQALAAGASGCCNSRAAPEVLRQVALVVGNGGLWVGQSLLQRLVGSTSRILGQHKAAKPEGDWSGKLSEREQQVARLVAAGSSNKEIAERLAITERTVKAHLTAVFEKLGLRDRLQLSLIINGL